MLLRALHCSLMWVGYGCPSTNASFQCITSTGPAGYTPPCGQSTPSYVYAYQSYLVRCCLRMPFVDLALPTAM